MHHNLAGLPRPVKQGLMVLADAAVVVLALWAALVLHAGVGPASFDPTLWALYALVPMVAIPLFALFGLYRAVVRWMGAHALATITKGVIASTLALTVIISVMPQWTLSLPVVLNFALLSLCAVGGLRIVVRGWFRRAANGEGDRQRQPVVIYGAGNCGIELASSLIGNTHYRPVAFVDDDPRKQGTIIQGLSVHPPQRLPALIDRERVAYVLLAMARLARPERRRIVERLEPLNVHILTIPPLSDLVTRRAGMEDVREVEVEDLLGRDAVAPRPELLRRCIAGHAVMVTGAGGSIGSELCRQILRLRPRRLVLVERSEFALYAIEKELRYQMEGQAHQPELHPVLGDVTDGERMQALMSAFAIHSVYHAAAYKHVPLVEANSLQGIHNNVFGTLRTAEAAAAAGVPHFVLISTDKAVRPTNVMGASKRMAEQVVQDLARRQGVPTVFSMVRFGNVLGSSGSVVPLFREQIRKGGPVTVTHPEVTRYFMTIPEAASLVIQAGAMARGGEVFVLDMGEPVRIDDLARRMIRLSGLTVRDEARPAGDIEIRYTGLRPGEKLYEELLLGEAVTGTDHPMICRASEARLPADGLQRLLEDLRRAAARFDCEAARQLLAGAVEGYEAPGPCNDVLGRRLAVAAAKRPPAISPWPAPCTGTDNSSNRSTAHSVSG
ncbi:polysaccharide biosynthesis protein [Alkalilimnicola ehrlichii]|uniref:polysaccharide biosynthesis protein n=1 Tax=Alkalilimnicola ehrlichii TaxID=351052 RepID=UPI003B9E8C10